MKRFWNKIKYYFFYFCLAVDSQEQAKGTVPAATPPPTKKRRTVRSKGPQKDDIPVVELTGKIQGYH